MIRFDRVSFLAVICMLVTGMGSDGAKQQNNSNQMPSCPPITKPGAMKGAPTGCFDFFILTQSWLPEFCSNSNSALKEYCNGVASNASQRMFVNSNLTIHDGLWPEFSTAQGEDAYPVYCTGTPYPHFDINDLSQATQNALISIAAPLNLLKHEWEKHGVCTNTSPEQYFSNVIELLKFTATPKVVTNAKEDASGFRSAMYNDIASHYGGKDKASITCSTSPGIGEYRNQEVQYLSSVQTMWSKDLKTMQSYTNIRSGECDPSKPIFIRQLASYTNISKLNATLKEKYNSNPINAGFDIDGTVLSSTALVQYIMNKCPSESEQPSCKMNAIRDFTASGLDILNIPKQVGFDLINMHLQRKDKVFFITARYNPGSPEKADILKGILGGVFSIPANQLNDIVFTSGESKTKYLQKKNIAVYYGDQDSDMIAAKEAGALPVRILEPNIKNDPIAKRRNIGVIGEMVVTGSNKLVFHGV